METTLPSHAQPKRARPPKACCQPSEIDIPTLDDATASTLAERLKALSDPTRLRMLTILAAQSEALCVCDITSQFRLGQPTISHHLRILRESGLIRGEKHGIWSYYQATELGRHSLSVIAALR